MHTAPDAIAPAVARLAAELVPELTAFRRRLHAHPERSGEEVATTAAVAERLRAAGLAPVVLRRGTGLVADIPGGASRSGGASGPGGAEPPAVVLRADLDALAMPDTKTVPYASTVPGVAHACGHDVHTSVVLGAGLVLTEVLRGVAGPGVRLVFEPCEETAPGGAVEVIDEGWLDGVRAVFGVHCDPKLDAGRVGLRTGPITSACDLVTVRLSGPGGHTARPHLTVDLVAVAGRLAADLQAAIDRRLEDRGVASVVFGALHAGTASNVIPGEATLIGTMRTPSPEVWVEAPATLEAAVTDVLGSSGAGWQVDHRRGVPAVVNDAAATEVLAEVGEQLLGPDGVTGTEHSMGGDSFAWYAERVPGSYARLGVHDPTSTQRRLDLHSGSFDVDERCIGYGVQFLALAACRALERLGADGRL